MSGRRRAQRQCNASMLHYCGNFFRHATTRAMRRLITSTLTATTAMTSTTVSPATMRWFFHIPPNLVVERFSQSSKASRGENLQVEHPICGGDAPAFHFDPTLARVLGSALIRDQVVQVSEPRQKRPLAPSGMMKGFHHE